jgi:hypothetical protein
MDWSWLLIGIAIPLFGVGLFAFVIWIIAQVGWSGLARRYAATADPAPDAQRFAFQSISIGALLTGARYNQIMTGWIADNGLFLQPAWPVSYFHPRICLPWDAIRDASHEAGLFAAACRLRIEGYPRRIAFYGRLGRAIAHHLSIGSTREITI